MVGMESQPRILKPGALTYLGVLVILGLQIAGSLWWYAKLASDRESAFTVLLFTGSAILPHFFMSLLLALCLPFRVIEPGRKARYGFGYDVNLIDRFTSSVMHWTVGFWFFQIFAKEVGRPETASGWVAALTLLFLPGLVLMGTGLFTFLGKTSHREHLIVGDLTRKKVQAKIDFANELQANALGLASGVTSLVQEAREWSASAPEQRRQLQELQVPGVYVYTYPQYRENPTNGRFLCKIGMTNTTIKERVGRQNRQTEVPEDIEVLLVFQTAMALELEKNIHEAFKDKRQKTKKGGTEWFWTTPQEILDLVGSKPWFVDNTYQDDSYKVS